MLSATAPFLFHRKLRPVKKAPQESPCGGRDLCHRSGARQTARRRILPGKAMKLLKLYYYKKEAFPV